MIRLIALCGASLLLAAGPATAAAAQTRQPPQVEALLACRANTNETARLACFDAAVAQMDQAVRSGSVTVVDRTEVRRMRRSLFGFSIPDIPFLGGGDRDGAEEAKELTAKIQSARSEGYNKWTLTLEGGAVWRTTEALRGFQTPKSGATVTLTKGALGSYWLQVGNGRPTKAMRVR
jgi:hypothetical protein